MDHRSTPYVRRFCAAVALASLFAACASPADCDDRDPACATRTAPSLAQEDRAEELPLDRQARVPSVPNAAMRRQHPAAPPEPSAVPRRVAGVAALDLPDEPNAIPRDSPRIVEIEPPARPANVPVSSDSIIVGDAGVDDPGADGVQIP